MMELIFHSRVQDAIAEIKARPLKYHRLDEIHRRCNLKRFLYHLVFEVTDDEIRITVLRHHQSPPTFGLLRKWH